LRAAGYPDKSVHSSYLLNNLASGGSRQQHGGLGGALPDQVIFAFE
jgi:hypothetical protein